jgi:hypothetical protein
MRFIYHFNENELENDCIHSLNNLQQEISNYKKEKLLLKLQSLQKKDNNTIPTSSNSFLNAYVDADFAKDQESRKSTTGIIVCVSNMTIYWKSKQQTSTASNTAEAEIIALNELSLEILYYKDILNDLGLKQGTISVFEDNQATIAIMTMPEKGTKMRHLDAKYFHIQEMVQNQVIDIKYVPSANNVADLMTKILPKATHYGLLKRLGLWKFVL